jgi:hypothetical protein
MSKSDVSTRMAAVPAWRRPASFVVGTFVVAALAFPVLAADPSADPSASAGPSVGASASAEPAASPQPSVSTAPSVAPSLAPVATPPRSFPTASPGAAGGGKPDKANKGDKTPAVPITLRGTIATTTDGKGRPTFSLTSGGTTYELSAGPPWFWGANNPLAPFVGKTVTVAGETRPGTLEVDVLAVDGTAIRAAGKPPWAGGWKVVGERHPGWSQAKADRFKAKFGDCFPPGQCKQAETAPTAVPRGD